MADSPFPGMNPYLEATGLWESVHSSLIIYMAAALNRVLPSPYVAVVEEWLHILPPRQRIRPDVVIGNAPAVPAGSVAVLERPPVAADAPFLVEDWEDEPRRRFHQHCSRPRQQRYYYHARISQSFQQNARTRSGRLSPQTTRFV